MRRATPSLTVGLPPHTHSLTLAVLFFAHTAGVFLPPVNPLLLHVNSSEAEADDAASRLLRLANAFLTVF